MVLAGCNATMPQQQRPTAADDPSAPCFRALPTNAALAPIANKIPLNDPAQATLGMLASIDRPTENEKVALREWAKLQIDCLEWGRQFRAQHAPAGWVLALEQGQALLMQAMAALYSGGTYGQFNGERKRTALRARTGMDAAYRNAQEAGPQDQGQTAQAARLQMMHALQVMQAFPPPTLPMPSPSVICTTRPAGGGAATTVCQ